MRPSTYFSTYYAITLTWLQGLHASTYAHISYPKNETAPTTNDAYLAYWFVCVCVCF